MVAMVVNGSATAAGGGPALLVGDEIIRINDKVVSNDTVRGVLRSIRPLTQVSIEVIRRRRRYNKNDDITTTPSNVTTAADHYQPSTIQCGCCLVQDDEDEPRDNTR
ncbi:hypothetical protein FOZ63_022968 [Perkinsus olseni]|nr:hypothetical protein FOZ63_022968 [Perkinsus olseni]